MTKYTNEQAEEALRATAGNVALAARQLHVDRSTLHRRIQKSPALQALVADLRAELIDIAESALRKGVLEGEAWAVIWALKASPEAKARGWSERTEHVGADGKDLFNAAAVIEALQRIKADGGATEPA